MEKAEAIVISKISDKIFALCRNARICVGGLRDAWTFRSFRAFEDGRGPCQAWIGGDEASCNIVVTTKSTKIPNGWSVDVRATMGVDRWTFPLSGFVPVDQRFGAAGETIDLLESTVAEIVTAARAAPRRILMVGRAPEDVFSMNVTCSQVAQAYEVESGTPALPPHVERASDATRSQTKKAAISAKDVDVSSYVKTYERIRNASGLGPVADRNRTLDQVVSDIVGLGDRISEMIGF